MWGSECLGLDCVWALFFLFYFLGMILDTLKGQERMDLFWNRWARTAMNHDQPSPAFFRGEEKTLVVLRSPKDTQTCLNIWSSRDR